jgi:hypothetical protein
VSEPRPPRPDPIPLTTRRTTLTRSFCSSCSACLTQTVQSIDRPESKTKRGAQPPPRLMRFRLDGSRTVEPSPTYKTLIRHAKRYGVEEIYETGEQAELRPAELAGLKADLREVYVGKRSRFGTKTKTVAANANDALALYEAGFTPEEIASRLNWPLSRVRKAIRAKGETR